MHNLVNMIDALFVLSFVVYSGVCHMIHVFALNAR